MPVSGTPKQFAGLVFGQHSGDVIVDDDDFIHLAEPLLRKHADRGRSAADTHAFFLHAVDDRRLVGLHDRWWRRRRSSARQLCRCRDSAGCRRYAVPSLAAAAGQVTHAAERQHLRSVFVGGDVADGLTLRAHGAAFGAEMPVGIDFQLDAAVAENSLGHDRDHIHASDFGRNDERSGLVVGIGRAGTNRGDEMSLRRSAACHPTRVLSRERAQAVSPRDMARSSKTCGSRRTSCPSALA